MRPPDPIAGDAVAIDQAGDHQRRIGGKGGGHHGGADQPPARAAAGDEIVGGAAAGSAAKVETLNQREGEIGGDDEPIDEGESHVRADCGLVWSSDRGRVKENGSARRDTFAVKRETPDLGGGGPDPGLGALRGTTWADTTFFGRDSSNANLVVQMPQKHRHSKGQLHAERRSTYLEPRPSFWLRVGAS